MPAMLDEEPKQKIAPIEVEPLDGVNYLQNGENGCKAILDKIGTDGLRMCCGKSRVEFHTGGRSPYCPAHHRLFNNVAVAQRKSYG